MRHKILCAPDTSEWFAGKSREAAHLTALYTLTRVKDYVGNVNREDWDV